GRLSSQTTKEWHPEVQLDDDSRKGSASSSSSPDISGPISVDTWSTRSDIGGPCGLAPPNYELLAEVGRGGLAIVYKARQINLGRIVALRVPHRVYSKDQTIITRFRIEATVLSRLQHPNIVQLFDFGQHEDGPYLALEFLEGGTLAEKLSG